MNCTYGCDRGVFFMIFILLSSYSAGNVNCMQILVIVLLIVILEHLIVTIFVIAWLTL